MAIDSTPPPARKPPEAPGAGRRGFWQRWLIEPLLTQLRQGISPRELSLSLALGTGFGIYPLLGASTPLCLVAGLWLRLNQPVIQLVNYLVYPLQLLLLIPFLRAGEWLWRAPPVPIIDVMALVGRFEADPRQFLIDYGLVGLYGLSVWLLLLAPTAVLIYTLSHRLLGGLAARR